MIKERYFNTRERQELKNIIYEKTGFYIRSNCLLIQAFTRSSFSAEQGGENNEILEFIGDQVLSYYVVKIIAERFGSINLDGDYTFRVRENRFTALKQELISNETLAKIIDDWGLAPYLIVGKSDYANAVDQQTKVKADLFEAILGTIALASNWDSEVLEKAVNQMLSMDEKINSIVETDSRPVSLNLENAINILKELAEHKGCSIPKYQITGPDDLGYDKDGNPRWMCMCSIINEKTGIKRLVEADSKKAAKKAAAYLVLCEHFCLQNQYGVNSFCGIWHYKDGKLIPGSMW